MLSPVAQPGELSDSERFMFESWGYLLIPGVLSPAEAGECYEASQRLHEGEDRTFGQVGRGYEKEAGLAALIDHPAVLPKARALYGDRFILQASWNTMQPAHSGCGQWHQDGSAAYDFTVASNPAPLLQLRASFLLNDQTEPGTGNMELIPGSHRCPLPLPAKLQQDGGDLPVGDIVCAPAGSVLLFHNGVWHRTYAHRGDRDRYTAHYIYSPPWMRFADRLENSPDFLARTTPMRRALMGQFGLPDEPYGHSYDPLPFTDLTSTQGSKQTDNARERPANG